MGRRLPVGAETFHGGAHFRVWTPRSARVQVVIEGGPRVALEPEESGHWSTVVRGVGAGARYRFQLDDDETLYPDPASRWQPDGPHGASVLVDPSAFPWTDAAWRGRTLREAVIYELHVGTFTQEGTWRAAAEHLAELAELGITVIEMMPVAEFAGRFGWGYDGVALFAPYHGYGAPDDLRAFVDRAHALGVAVILDVVYNHLGPDGNYLHRFAPEAFTDRYETDWGAPPDFDGPRSGPVRELFLANARHWIEEHHFDGLRLDATQNIYDFGEGEHILAAIARVVREAAGDRATLLIGENESQDARLLARRDEGGFALDALWNDDFHHSVSVALTGRREAYLTDYQGSARELAAAAKHGFLFQGQRYAWQGKRRGTPTLGLDPSVFVAFLENHDQVANSPDGARIHRVTSAARHRAATALVLVGPGTPMLFQGAEFLSPAPFLYFADHRAELAPLVRAGRADFLAQFPSMARPEVRERLHDPADPAAFERCKLDRSARARPEGATHLAMVRALLAMRRDDRVLAGDARRAIDACALDDHAVAVRYFGRARGDDRLVVVNLGPQRDLPSISEPLIAPPLGMRWETRLTTEDPAWGGRGSVPFEQDDGVHLTAECTLVLGPAPDPVSRDGVPVETKRASAEGGAER